jgi:hypothetical protein
LLGERLEFYGILNKGFDRAARLIERTAPKDFITQAEAGYYNNFKRLHRALCGRVRADFLGESRTHDDSLSSHHWSEHCPQGMR